VAAGFAAAVWTGSGLGAVDPSWIGGSGPAGCTATGDAGASDGAGMMVTTGVGDGAARCRAGDGERGAGAALDGAGASVRLGAGSGSSPVGEGLGEGSALGAGAALGLFDGPASTALSGEATDVAGAGDSACATAVSQAGASAAPSRDAASSTRGEATA
jgi:hypothetical protein